MAWDFQTEPEFQEQLDWTARFVREEIWPIEPIADELDQAALERIYARLLLAGIAASHYGLRHTALVYAAAAAELAASALVSLIVHARRESDHRAAPIERPVPSPPGPCTIPPCLPAEPVERAPEAVSG
jgi:hypothetical protein